MPRLYTETAIGLMSLDEWDAAEEILKYSLKWTNLPCIKRAQLLNRPMTTGGLAASLNSFKAVIHLKLREVRIRRSLPKLKQVLFSITHNAIHVRRSH